MEYTDVLIWYDDHVIFILFSSVHNHHTWTVIHYLFLHHHDNQTPLSQQIIGSMAGRKLLPTAQGPSRQARSVSNDRSISTPGSGSLSAPFVASVDDDSRVIAPVAISCLEIRHSVRVTSKARLVQPTVQVPPIASRSKGGKRYPSYIYKEVLSSADVSDRQPGPHPPAVPFVHVTGSRAFTTTQVNSEVVGTSLGGRKCSAPAAAPSTPCHGYLPAPLASTADFMTHFVELNSDLPDLCLLTTVASSKHLSPASSIFPQIPCFGEVFLRPHWFMLTLALAMQLGWQRKGWHLFPKVIQYLGTCLWHQEDYHLLQFWVVYHWPCWLGRRM